MHLHGNEFFLENQNTLRKKSIYHLLSYGLGNLCNLKTILVTKYMSNIYSVCDKDHVVNLHPVSIFEERKGNRILTNSQSGRMNRIVLARYSIKLYCPFG